MLFTIHDKTTAPAAAVPVMEATEKAFGFLPNLYGVFAESPAALGAYAAVNEVLQHCALSPVEQQVVALTVSTENHCSYCVGAHSAIAGMVHMPAETLLQLRLQQTLSEPRDEALRQFTLAVLQHRGWVPAEKQQAFQTAGFSQQHMLDTLTIVALKTLSNYTNHLAHTPLDAQFAELAWQPPKGENHD
ncbi:MAG TPA: carboxymuconolactone decarboxylase family protein [Gammaproteobacteria bacterium]|nr:carboxymuconolactone decarboxylase family protein [Gammaproteobacteria bacterium]